MGQENEHVALLAARIVSWHSPGAVPSTKKQ